MPLAKLKLPLRAFPSWNLLCRPGSQRTLPLQSSSTTTLSIRYASVKAQGAYKLKSKKTLPKKMGAKRVGDQYVLPGTIIYKQRGTIWHPGENTILGRDHTIHSAVAGYVKYYRDAKRHPDRQYIGVALDRDDMLPQSYDAIRKRRLGMVAVTRKAVAITDTFSKSGIPQRVIRKEGVIEHGGLELATSRDAATTEAAVEAAESAAREATNGSRELGGNETRAKRAARRWNTYIRIKRSNRMLFLRKDYSYRESNFQIGRLMGKHKGKTPGTQRYGSRRSLLRHRRQKREERLRQMKEMERQVAQERTPRAGKAASKAVGKKPPQKTRGAKKTAS